MPPIVRPAKAIEPDIPTPSVFVPFPLLQRRLNSRMVPVHGFLEGFDLLSDLGVDTAANCDRGVEVADLLGLALEPGMDDRPAFVGVLLLLLEIFPNSL